MLKKKQGGGALYRQTDVNEYDQPAHIFALDYYRPGSGGDHEFSRKETWFYYFGDDEIQEEFTERVDDMVNELFVENSVDWDYFTLAPSSRKASLNEHMEKLCSAISEKKVMEYRQVLERSRGIEESREFESVKQKLANQKNSIDIKEDVDGKNIIIVDNVSVSGISLAFLTELLLNAGAERVSCLVLGVTNHERFVRDLEEGIRASTAMAEIQGENNG
ncbi:MAG: phosphoribosyltransferase family protein [Candidatus Nanohaloarchaea archaeon]